MGLIIEVSARVSTEARRESVAIQIPDATVDPGRMEIAYSDVPAVILGLCEAVQRRADGNTVRATYKAVADCREELLPVLEAIEARGRG